MGKASHRTLSRARQRVLVYDDLLLWPFREEEAEPRGTEPPGLWPEVALDLWQRFRHLLKAAERLAEMPVAWVR